MKKIAVFIFISLALAGALWAQAAGTVSETAVSSAISEVTVYSDRAVVSREASFDMKAGTASFVFDSLPEGTDPSSIQLKGQGPAVQEDLIFRTKYFSAIPDDRVKALQASRDESSAKAQALTDGIRRLDAESAFLKRITDKVTSSTETGAAELNPEKWQQMVKFYRDRMAAIDQEKRGFERDLAAANAETARIDGDLNRLSSGRQKKKNQAVAVLSSEKGGAVTLTLTYTVAGASWRPSYDIRVDSAKKRVKISYNASIAQNTGEDWDGVRLSLSTARAEIGGDQPELEAWYLRLYKQSAAGRSSSAKPMAKAEAAPAQLFNAFAAEDLKDAISEEAPMAARGAQAQTGATSVVFNVGGKAKIVSDALQHRVFITSLDVGAYFRYSTAPKLSMFAYLKAKVKNEGDFPLLQGESKVFLDGNFVSDSSVDATAPGQEFWVFLGVDEGVKVDYKLVKKVKDEGGVFDKKNRYVYQYETTVSNAKKVDIELVLWDQLPISGDKSVVVKLLDPKYSKDTEALKKNEQDIFEWLFNIKAGEKVKLPFSFSVEYPQDSYLEGLEL
jgi:uncharacterized protein (TIGR02231 family)